MVSKYYYFVSSLPLLRLGDAPPLRSAEFLDLSQYHLPPRLQEELTAISLLPRERHCCPAEAGWNDFELALRNAVVRARASRQSREAQPFLKLEAAAFGFLESQIQDAFNRDPLRLEEELDHLRWRVLDDLIVGRDYDFDRLFVYRIKLLLLEKRAGLDTDAGKQQTREQLNQKLESSELLADIIGSTATG